MTAPSSYPYTAWVLLPSFKPKEVVFVKTAVSYAEDYGCVSESGKWYRRSQIQPTKDAAIAFGRSECERMQADIDKKQASLNSKRAALDKAST